MFDDPHFHHDDNSENRRAGSSADEDGKTPQGQKVEPV